MASTRVSVYRDGGGGDVLCSKIYHALQKKTRHGVGHEATLDNGPGFVYFGVPAATFLLH